MLKFEAVWSIEKTAMCFLDSLKTASQASFVAEAVGISVGVELPATSSELTQGHANASKTNTMLKAIETIGVNLLMGSSCFSIDTMRLERR
jgi:hypothetical protein